MTFAVAIRMHEGVQALDVAGPVDSGHTHLLGIYAHRIVHNTI